MTNLVETASLGQEAPGTRESHRLWKLILGALHYLTEARRLRRDICFLKGLDDHHLKDMGISRSEIESRVRGDSFTGRHRRSQEALVAPALNAVRNAVVGGFQSLAQANRMQREIDHLMGLDDHRLDDIGLTRCEIENRLRGRSFLGPMSLPTPELKGGLFGEVKTSG